MASTFGQCQATTHNGAPCAAKANSSGFCVTHDPRAAQWRVMGGHGRRNANRARKLMPSRLEPLIVALEQTFHDIHEEKLDPKVGQAMATIAVAIGKLIQTGELEERTRELEKLAKSNVQQGEKWAF